MTSAFWLTLGVVLCCAELVLPTTFIVFNMGLAAFVVALVSYFLPWGNVLVALWVLFSLVGLAFSRRFLASSKSRKDLGDDREGRTLTAILPGQTGRVLYEGNSWQAKCVDSDLAISQEELVYVVEKRGNTLIVLPSKLLP